MDSRRCRRGHGEGHRPGSCRGRARKVRRAAGKPHGADVRIHAGDRRWRRRTDRGAGTGRCRATGFFGRKREMPGWKRPPPQPDGALSRLRAGSASELDRARRAASLHSPLSQQRIDRTQGIQRQLQAQPANRRRRDAGAGCRFGAGRDRVQGIRRRQN